MSKYKQLGQDFMDLNNRYRWPDHVVRPYTPEVVAKVRGNVEIEHSIALTGSAKLWELMKTTPPIRTLGAVTGNQAIQIVKAGLKAIYLSGWQTAADANLSGEMYPDQSLYPANSVPDRVRAINRALIRADQIRHAEGDDSVDWMAPIVADAEAGFGGVLNSYELMKAMIEAGASGVHFEDQLSSEKRCGHMGGKTLIPTGSFIKHLISARFAADVMGVPTILIARTDAESAVYITSDVDDRDVPFIERARKPGEDFFILSGDPMDRCIARGLAYAPHADVLWFETSTPSIAQAKRFADAIHAKFPDKMLAYNCSPSFNWKKNLNDDEIADFQIAIGNMGYRFQFVTLAGFHALNASMFELAYHYAGHDMSGFVTLQNKEFDMERRLGFDAIKHQRFVGTGYFDLVRQVIDGDASMSALSGSTEDHQFVTPGLQQEADEEIGPGGERQP